eukprot:TRINITY_DN6122_c0_g1_i1.p2 TRINITY_DN6122_c0_g1~~TRINITY_DN6122_c0_g1_i1.p2  ORF type:complete len:387 (+),score=91.47 TRINITY_DN6122_c0_g1_i1:1924-3084(+)
MACDAHSLVSAALCIIGCALVVLGIVRVADVEVSVVMLCAGAVMIVAGAAYKLTIFTQRCLFVAAEEAGECEQGVRFATTCVVVMEGGNPAVVVQPSSGVASVCCMILLHGKGRSAFECEDFAQMYADHLQCTVVLPEYPGYPLYKKHHPHSTPSTRGVERVAAAAHRHAVEVMGFSPSRIIACGASIGTGGAAWLAAHHSVAALVLISPYARLTTVIEQVVEWHTCGCLARLAAWVVYPCASWRPEALVVRSDAPLLVIHGAQDALITLDHTRKILGAAVDLEYDLDTLEHDKLCKYGRVWVRVSSGAGHIFKSADDLILPVILFVRHVLGDSVGDSGRGVTSNYVFEGSDPEGMTANSPSNASTPSPHTAAPSATLSSPALDRS